MAAHGTTVSRIWISGPPPSSWKVFIVPSGPQMATYFGLACGCEPLSVMVKTTVVVERIEGRTAREEAVREDVGETWRMGLL
jgi:hypothetical protein